MIDSPIGNLSINVAYYNKRHTTINLMALCMLVGRYPSNLFSKGNVRRTFPHIWVQIRVLCPYLRDFCPIFGYFVALEIEQFARAHMRTNPKSLIMTCILRCELE